MSKFNVKMIDLEEVLTDELVGVDLLALKCGLRGSPAVLEEGIAQAGSVLLSAYARGAVTRNERPPFKYAKGPRLVMTGSERLILSTIEGEVTVNDLVTRTTLSKSAISHALLALKGMGEIKKVGSRHKCYLYSRTHQEELELPEKEEAPARDLRGGNEELAEIMEALELLIEKLPLVFRKAQAYDHIEKMREKIESMGGE